MRNWSFPLLLAFMLVLPACVPQNFSLPPAGNAFPQPSGQPFQPAPQQLQFSGLPRSFADFQYRAFSACKTPEGAVKMYFDALYSYMAHPDSHSDNMLDLILHGDGWTRESTFLNRIKNPAYHYIFRSYAQGSSPENNYRMDPNNYTLMFDKTVQDNGFVRVFVRSSGADSPRPLWVQRFDDGLWYVINHSSIYSKVREPRTPGQSYPAPAPSYTAPVYPSPAPSYTAPAPSYPPQNYPTYNQPVPYQPAPNGYAPNGYAPVNPHSYQPVNPLPYQPAPGYAPQPYNGQQPAGW